MMNFSKLKYISILLVQEDEQLSDKIINSFKKIFEKIYVAKNTDEAFEIYKKNKNSIDMVLLDIPASENVYAVKGIRKIAHDTPILSFIYCDDINLLRELFDLDVDKFLIKPVNIYKLFKKINKLAETIVYKKELKAKEDIIDNNLIYSETDTKGIITYVSKAFIKISGYTREELIGKPHNIIRHPNVNPSVFREMWQTIKSGKSWSGEIRNLKKDGEEYTVKSVVSPIYNKNKLIGFGSARLDITQLKENSKQLHFHSKHKAMNELLSMVSHHWRQPIASIGLEADNALFDITMEGIKKDSITDSFTNIKKQVKHLSGVLDTFKGFFEKSSKQVMSIEALIKNVIFIMQGPLQEHNISLQISLSNQDKAIFTHKSELINILINIIINAKENIVRNSIENGHITISSQEIGDNTLEIRILDNGGGIDSKIIENIFEPYISTKEAKNGTGLGLYIAKELIEKKLHGSICANNVKDGAEFILNIRGVVNG